MEGAVKKIKTFDREALDEIDAEVMKALEEFAKARGLTVRTAGGNWSEGIYTMKLRLSVTNAGRIDFQKYARGLGLKPEDYGREFTHQGEVYRIVGISPTRSKYSIETERVADGSSLRFTPRAVAEELEFGHESKEERSARYAKMREEQEKRNAEWRARMEREQAEAAKKREAVLAGQST
jgi:hypothetical protein